MPRRRWPAWLTWVLVSGVVLVALVVAAGFVGGVGPLGRLGQTTADLSPVGYRPTPNDRVIQVSVAMPPSGLCRDDLVDVTAFERSNRVEVESTVTRPRDDSCVVATIGGDVTWVDVELDEPLGSRSVIRATDRQPLPREESTPG